MKCRRVTENSASRMVYVCDEHVSKYFYSPTSFMNELYIYKMNLPYVPKLISYSYFPPNIKMQRVKIVLNCMKKMCLLNKKLILQRQCITSL